MKFFQGPQLDEEEEAKESATELREKARLVATKRMTSSQSSFMLCGCCFSLISKKKFLDFDIYCRSLCNF